MAKTINMSGFEPLLDNLEEYVNKQGCTLGKDAEVLQELLHCIQYCYIHGVIIDSQCADANRKFRKKFQAALQEL